MSLSNSSDTVVITNAQASDAGSYVMELQNICGSVASDNVVLTIESLPTVFAGADTTICMGDSIILAGSGASTYLWDNSVTNGVGFVPTSTTTYTVIGTTINGCENTDALVVNLGLYPTIIQSGSELTTGTFSSYQWYLNGAIISGATGQSYTPVENGNYMVEVSNGRCTETSSELVFTLGGIESAMFGSIKLYPNPSTGAVNIELENYSKNTTISIINELGQPVFEKDNMNAQLQLELESGVYFVRIRNSYASCVQKLLIK